MYPCSIKTREVLGNPSPMPKRFPETRDQSTAILFIIRAFQLLEYHILGEEGGYYLGRFDINQAQQAAASAQQN